MEGIFSQTFAGGRQKVILIIIISLPLEAYAQLSYKIPEN